MLEWFLSRVSLREFRPDESGITRHFIRKAIEALHLNQLRKRRDRGEDGVDELATMKINNFCLLKEIDYCTDKSAASCDPDSPEDLLGPKLTIEEKSQFVLEWFLSVVSLRELLPDEKCVPRYFIRKEISA